jgi:hypothetical protein
MAKFILAEGAKLGFTYQTSSFPGVLIRVMEMFKTNPYIPAYDEAVATGESMAEFLIAHFSGYYINLVGFSLGTEVILHIMSRLAGKSRLGMLNKVYLFGGVADVYEVQEIL